MATPRARKVRDPVDVSEVAPIIDMMRRAKDAGEVYFMNAAERSMVKAFAMQMRIELALPYSRIGELCAVDEVTVRRWLFDARSELAEVDKKDLAEWIVHTLHDKAEQCYRAGDYTEGRKHLELAATLTGMMPQRGALVDNRTVILTASDEQLRQDRERAIERAREAAREAGEIPVVMRKGTPQLTPPNGSNGNGHAHE